MMKEKIKSVTPLLAVLMLTLVLGGCARSGPYKCYLGSYPGRVLDMDTGEPLEGVVIHVTYRAYGASGAGMIATQVAVRETLTDAEGEYLIPAETIMDKCFSGNLQGDFQLFKPGYGYIGKSQLSCPGGKRKDVPWSDEPACLLVPDNYLIWELPKLKTKKERNDNLACVHPALDIPYSEQPELRRAISKERVFIGLSPLSGVKQVEKNED